MAPIGWRIWDADVKHFALADEVVKGAHDSTSAAIGFQARLYYHCFGQPGVFATEAVFTHPIG